MKHVVLIILMTGRVLACVAGDTTSVSKVVSSGNSSALKKADAVFADEQYMQALNLYTTALNADAKNPNLNFKVALCHSYLLHQPKGNISLLKTALNNFSDKYNFYNTKESRASVDAYYYLGKNFMYDGQIDSGMQYLVYYQNLLHNDLPLDAGRQLKMCINAKQLMKKPRELNVTDLGQPVNSDYDESRPVISLDNKVLFFASRRPDKQGAEGQLHDDDIYYSIANDNGKFGTPQAFSFNTPFDEEPVSISSNGNTLYFRRTNKKGMGDIYYSEKTDEKWGEPKKMKKVNSAADEQGLSISNDGTMLILCSNRPGGEGGYDLYMATGKNGNWGALKNLGTTVNSDMDEISPFIFPGGKRIYFSTNGNTEYGMGGFDVFFTEPDSIGKKWSKPFTMGYPVNTSGNEFDYAFGSQGKTLYTSVGKSGNLDLFDIVAGEFKQEIQDQISEVVATSGETQTVAVVEVEKEKKVEVEKEVEVSKIQEVEKDVEKNVGYVNVDEAKKLDKVVAVQKEEVEVQNIVETEKLVYTNQSQHTIDSLNGVAAQNTSGSADNNTAAITTTTNNITGNTVTTNVAINPNNDGKAVSADNTEKRGAAKATPTHADSKTEAQKQIEEAKAAEEKAKEENDIRAEKVLANISKEDREALIKKIKEDLTKEMKEKRSAVFKTFYFNFNSDEVQLENYELRILVDFLREHKDVNIEVVGHTDNRGSWETNFWISRQRAKSVYDYLAKNKIATSRMIFNGKGAIDPVGDNSSNTGRAQNRRVEIILIQ